MRKFTLHLMKAWLNSWIRANEKAAEEMVKELFPGQHLQHYPDPAKRKGKVLN